MTSEPVPITTADIEFLKSSMKTDAVKGRVVAGKYQILGVIAAGGMGVVLRARHLQLQSLVAVKFSFDASSSTAAQRFLNEAQVLTKLRHPGVAQVLDAGSEAGALYLVMELIEGQSLLAWVKDSLKLTGEGPELDTLFEKLAGLADALSYCHSQGVVHRDLKPANVILRESDGQPVLVDFGLAMWEDEDNPEKNKLTQTGEVMGTPHYMAPEQVENHSEFGEIGPASDVWALGAILFYSISGQTPYPEGPALQFYKHLMTKDPRTLSEVHRQSPAFISDFCASCLNRQAAERPTMDECREFFQSAFDEESSQQKPILLYASILFALITPLTLLAYFLHSSQKPLAEVELLTGLKVSAKKTTDNKTTITGRVHETIQSMKINGRPCLLTNGQFEERFPLKEGKNVFTILLNNGSPREFKKSISVTSDQGAPRINLVGFKETALVLEKGQSLRGEVTDISPVTLTINKKEIKLDPKGRFQFSDLKEDQAHRLQLKAWDSFGFETVLSLTVVFRPHWERQFQGAINTVTKAEASAVEKTISLLTQLIELNPKDPRPYFYRAQSQLLKKDDKKALEDLSQFLEQNRDLRSPLLPKAFHQSYKIYDSLKSYEFALKSLDGGIEYFERVNKDKNDPAGLYSELHSLRASCRLWRFRRYQDALDDYEKGLKLDPAGRAGDNPNRAHCYRRLGKVETALKILNESIDKNIATWSALIYRAEIKKEKKLYKASLRDYEAARRLNPKIKHKHYDNIDELKELIAKGESND